MSKQSSSTCDIALFIAPYCFNSNSPWYSPGRSQKILQTETLLASLSFSLFRINTAPDPIPYSPIPHLQLSRAILPVLRLIISVSSIFLFLISRPFRRATLILWIYNTRLSEALIAFIILLFTPALPLYLQIEDLPRARSQNRGIRGLLDVACLRFLVRRSTHIFVVSPVVAQVLQSISSTTSAHLTVLPPLLSPDFLLTVDQRSQPFSQQITTILYAGGYGIEKGVSDLIQAFLRLPPDLFSLQLAGAVPDALVSSLPSNYCIQILGHLNNSELYSYYANADVLVSPHRITEHSSSIFPFKLIEYVASGALPLTTPMPGVELLCLPNDCLFETVDDLTSKLLNSRALWLQHKQSIVASSFNLRYSYSYKSLQPALATQLGRTHLVLDI
jgi:glycosyltransferase involved in cell wall biosynthesis